MIHELSRWSNVVDSSGFESGSWGRTSCGCGDIDEGMTLCDSPCCSHKDSVNTFGRISGSSSSGSVCSESLIINISCVPGPYLISKISWSIILNILSDCSSILWKTIKHSLSDTLISTHFKFNSRCSCCSVSKKLSSGITSCCCYHQGSSVISVLWEGSLIATSLVSQGRGSSGGSLEESEKSKSLVHLSVFCLFFLKMNYNLISATISLKIQLKLVII